MNLVSQFQDFIKKNNLFTGKDRLLIAVSGGVDSVVLCELCRHAGFDFTAVHCNFQLRQEESTRDEDFVARIAKQYGVRLLIKKFETETYAASKKISIQEAARDLRYTWFAQLVNDFTYSNNENTDLNPVKVDPVGKIKTYLLTAHHADDNAETVLMNFCRGTGLHGLTGIPVSNDYIRRPLLFASKAELLEFAVANGLEFVEDSSNQSSKYTRNYFRNEVMPMIREVFPKLNENLQDNAHRFTEIEKLYKLSVAGIKKKLCKVKGVEVHIPVKQLMGFNNKALIYDIIHDYGFNEKQVDEVVKLSESESGKFISSSNSSHRIIRHRHWFIISPIKSREATNILIEENNKVVEFEGGKLSLEILPAPLSIPTAPETGCFDKGKIEYPLLLRPWKTGDYFYPLGMKKKKKLNRFFIDQKLSRTEKEKIWVLESNLRIIWVLGIRIDERFKVNENTRSVLKVTFNNGQPG